MKTTILFALTFFTAGLFAQTPRSVPDTLLQENFAADPSESMLSEATGNDVQWVNYDMDGVATLCSTEDIIPTAWYWEADLGDSSTNNYAYTSCSYLSASGGPNHPINRNWLITPPIEISDSTFGLTWRSLSLQGPQYMDGYHVLISTSANIPSADFFQDTLFSAAEMLSSDEPYSLNLADYTFSPGYIHAEGYSKPDYFFIDMELAPAGLYHGKMEPHGVSLKNYANQTVYIAFLHDSDDDFLLQIDDIVVSSDYTSRVNSPNNVLKFNVLPNVVQDVAVVQWQLTTAEPVRLQLTNTNGQVLQQLPLASRDEGMVRLQVSALPAGMYYCTLQTAQAQKTVRFVKQ